MSQFHGYWLSGAGSKLQISGAYGSGGVQSNNGSNTGTFGHRLSQSREASELLLGAGYSEEEYSCFPFCFVDPLALRADNGRWYTPLDLGQLCCGESLGAGTGQLSLDHRSHA